MRSALLFLLVPALCAAAQTPPPAPADPAAQLAQAAAVAQQHGDLKTAIDDDRKALQLHPERVAVRVQLAAALLAAGQPDAAIAEDTRVLHAEPGNTAAQINAATAYFRIGDVNRARYLFELIHKQHPGNAGVAMGLAYTYLKMQRPADAADLLAPLEAANAANLDFEYVLAYAQILSGRQAQGVQRMEKVAQARHAANAWMIAATTLFQDRQFQQAETDAAHAIAINPAFPGAQTLAGQARYALGQVDKATANFQAALQQNPRDFTANLYLGIIRSTQRDFATARPLLELAVDLAPNHPLARLELAKLNSMTGHEAEAVQTLETLEKETPQWIDPHIQLATLYYKLHRPADGQREREIVQKLQDQQQQAGPRQP